MRGAKKDIMGAKNINVLVGENQISNFKMNGRRKNFVENLNMIMDYQCLVINYLLNNIF